MARLILPSAAASGRRPDASWRGSAACLDADTELFFPAGVTGPAADIRAAKAICGRCPVRACCPGLCPGYRPGCRDMGRLRRERAQAHAPGTAPLCAHAARGPRAAAMTSTHRWLPADGTGPTVTLLPSQVGLRLHGEAEMRARQHSARGDRGSARRRGRGPGPPRAGGAELHRCAQHPGTDRPGPPGAAPPDLASAPYSLTRLISLLWPGCCPFPAPSGNRTGDSATVSIKAPGRQRNEGDARAKVQPVHRAANR
jgi:Transcription factor WhiB